MSDHQPQTGVIRITSEFHQNSVIIFTSENFLAIFAPGSSNSDNGQGLANSASTPSTSNSDNGQGLANSASTPSTSKSDNGQGLANSASTPSTSNSDNGQGLANSASTPSTSKSDNGQGLVKFAPASASTSKNDRGQAKSTQPMDSGKMLAELKPLEEAKKPTTSLPSTSTVRDSPRELRNKAEKLRRDTLNQSIAQLASMVPPVVHSSKKVDKIGVLRYTAHYLRVNQYVFDSPPDPYQFSGASALAILSLLKGFLLTTTYKGLIVVVSQNIKEYLGYTELELLGKSVFDIIHKDDQQLLREQLMPRTQSMGRHGELLMPNDEEGRQRLEQRLSNEQRLFLVRFLKLGSRNEASRYVTCHVEGSFRISDRAKKGYNRSWVRRARARGENPCNSGNDVIFVGVVRPCTETFINESALEFYRLEYRTRHTIDGEIIQCEQRICLVTGYMMEEVSGVNAMNFIHRAEVRWVIIALKEMYNQNQVYGESCYRLMTKTGHFIYMRTRGRLDVDTSSRTVTSFLCTNTVVDEREGQQLIRMMKERYTVQAQCEGHFVFDESSDRQAVEDPRQLEKAILNMVTTLPSPEEDINPEDGTYRGNSPSPRLSLVTNKRERIVSAIEKIYTVFKTIPGYERSESPEYMCENTLHEQSIQVLATIHEEMTMTTSTYTTENSTFAPFDTSYQDQGTSDGGYNSENSPVVSSDDFGSASGSTMTSSQEEMALALEEENVLAELAFEIITAEDFMPGPSTPSTSTAGVKRPSRFEEDEDNTSKKKVTVTTEQETSGRSDAPVLETFFDPATLNAHIQSAIETLEDEGFESNLPDFLSLSEVEDILDAANDNTEQAEE